MQEGITTTNKSNTRSKNRNADSPKNGDGKKLGNKNINKTERIISGFGGGMLALYGLGRRDLAGATLALIGGGLLYRGTTGHCSIYDSLNINTAEKQGSAAVHAGAGVKVEKSITVNATSEKLYNFWRNFGNLPQFMNHLIEVKTIDEKRSHWKAKAPLGMSVEWDAEIINDKPNEMISWRSTENADIANVGSVHFTPSTDGKSTVVKVSLSYEPPAGKIGEAIAWLTGEEPSVQIAEDLRRFKQIIEAGEIPSVEKQPSGRK